MLNAKFQGSLIHFSYRYTLNVHCNAVARTLLYLSCISKLAQRSMLVFFRKVRLQLFRCDEVSFGTTDWLNKPKNSVILYYILDPRTNEREKRESVLK